jgi:hypothetical protein
MGAPFGHRLFPPPVSNAVGIYPGKFGGISQKVLSL